MGPQDLQPSPDAYRAQREVPALMTEGGKPGSWSPGTQGGGWVLVERGWPESGIQGERGVEGHAVDGTRGREDTGWLGHRGLGQCECNRARAGSGKSQRAKPQVSALQFRPAGFRAVARAPDLSPL